MDARDPSDRNHASVQHIRETAAARVEATSLRRVAREIGMSPTGLRKFLDGTEPYTPTVHRLRVWYLRLSELPSADIGREDASAALAVLTRDLPETPRRSAAETVLETLDHCYRASGKGRPTWVAELRAEYGVDRGQ